MRISSKVNVLRALSAVVARRAIRLFFVVDTLFLLISLAGIWALATHINSWWWLLLIVYIPLLIVSCIIYFIARFISYQLYPRSISSTQKSQLRDFTDTLLRLLETRGMGWWVFASLCVRDLLFYRELRTLKSLIGDIGSLKSSFTQLENDLDLDANR